MNKKEQVMNEVLDIVIKHCEYSFYPITQKEVKDKRGARPIQKTRAIFVTMLLFLDYDISIIARFMDRTIQDIECIKDSAHEFRISKDWAYLTSEAECIKECEQFKDINN